MLNGKFHKLKLKISNLLVYITGSTSSFAEVASHWHKVLADIDQKLYRIVDYYTV